MTNSTEELRRLLDERGVEWFGSYDSDETSWDVGELTWVYVDNGNIAGLGAVQGDITPEQAIAATLGRGTCRNEWAEFGTFRCSECWMQVGSISTNTVAPRPIKFCPNCGREVVDA